MNFHVADHIGQGERNALFLLRVIGEVIDLASLQAALFRRHVHVCVVRVQGQHGVRNFQRIQFFAVLLVEHVNLPLGNVSRDYVFGCHDDVRSAGGELRLYLRPLPKLADKSALIEYILTAPAAEIFCSGIPHMPFPAAPQRRDERPCAVCGELTREDFLQIRCGVPVCADCAEKQSPDR